MSRLLDIARKEIGTTEDPPDSNKTKYGEWFGVPGAWCGMFVSWCYYMAGIDLPKIGWAKPGFASCQQAVNYFRKAKKIVSAPKEGDIVFYDWTGDGRSDHTGIFVRRLSDTMFEAIEGNTSIANDSNGGKVMVRKRPYRRALFVRP